jgi:hypothetical protein
VLAYLMAFFQRLVNINYIGKVIGQNDRAELNGNIRNSTHISYAPVGSQNQFCYVPPNHENVHAKERHQRRIQ